MFFYISKSMQKTHGLRFPLKCLWGHWFWALPWPSGTAHTSCVKALGFSFSGCKIPLPPYDSRRVAMNTFISGFLSLGTVDILGQLIICRGGWPVYCRMLNSFPGVYPLDASNTPLTAHTHTQTISPDITRCLLGEKSLPAENH